MALANVLLAGVYYGAASFGLSMAFQHKLISLVWPPSGIAIAAVALLGFRLLPGVFLGAFLINFAVARSFPVALGIGFGNMAEAFAAVTLLRLSRFRHELDRIQDVISLVVFAAWIPSIVSATIGTSLLVASGSLPQALFKAAWLRWWLGDVMGVCVMSPLIFLFVRRPRFIFQLRRAGEAASLGILIVVFHFAFKDSGMPYLVFPMLFWAATRFGRTGAVVSTFVVSAGTVWYTLRGLGPFVRLTPEQSLLAAQSFIGVETVTGLAIAAGLSEYRKREEQRLLLLNSEEVKVKLGFLAEASAVLGSSLCYTTTLANITRLVVPKFADYCVIVRRDRDNNPIVVKATHRDPVLENEVMPKLIHHHPSPAKGHPVGIALEEGRSVLVKQMSDDFLREITNNEEHLALIRRLQPSSYIAVPMRTGQQNETIVGVLICARTAPSGLLFSEADLAFAEDLAQRCASAIERADLYASAQEAVRQREDTMAIVSHDLKNPLAAILLSAKLLERTLGTPKARPELMQEIVRRLIDSAGHCTRLVENLLAAAKLESGLFSAKKAWVPVQTTINDAISELLPLASAKGVTLRVNMPNSPQDMYCDRIALYQIISNVVGNGVKFTPSGGEVVLELKALKGEFHFSVRDNGPGISPEGMSHIFERYWQQGNGTHQGAGLGLSIAKGYVAAHEGRIWAESVPGKGTTFHFTIPQPAEEERKSA
ncbi:MAG: sensor histidine kinase [Bdellovibrionota bacterium]